MSDVIRLDDQKLSLSLPTLKGAFTLEDLRSLQTPPSQKLLQIKPCDDPRQPGKENIEALGTLPDIHKHIAKISNLTEQSCQPSIDDLLQAFSLSAIFILYFRRYELHQEPWGCQDAWIYLLRLRYHTIIRLYESKGKLEEDQQGLLKVNLVPARRDWADFCQNAEHHYLLSPQSQQQDEIKWPQPLTDVEDEVAFIIRPAKNAPPYSYYLSDSGGRFLDRLIADWFLSSRYDWFGAFCLAYHRARALMRQRWKSALALGLCSILIVWLHCYAIRRWGTGQINCLSLLLSLIYPLPLIGLLLGCAWRTVMDLLLPRLWAGVLVGYLPLFVTSELWKIAYDPMWPARRPLGIVMLNAIAGLLTFGYLRWAVGNRLARTPGLSASVPVYRALWLTIYGWMVSVISGLIIFSLAGSAMARACLANANGELPASAAGTLGLFGPLHLSSLFLFAPFALLVGIIVQIFWEEKSITHPA